MEHLLRLGIDPEGPRNAVKFYESYANTVLAQLRAPALEGRGSLQERNFRRGEIDDILLADAVSSLRAAGQWELFLSPLRGARLLGRAGELLRAQGHAFGTFLRLISGQLSDDLNDDRLRREIDLLGILHRNPADVRGDLPEAMRHPQQQAYLLVALCAMPNIATEYRLLLQDICNTSPHRDGGTPVGALGLPIRHYWSIATSLLEERADDFVRSRLSSFVARYLDDVLSARSNAHLWNNAASPVDVGDVDTVGIVALAARRFGQASMASQVQDFARTLGRSPRSVDTVPLELGLELAAVGRDRPTEEDWTDPG